MNKSERETNICVRCGEKFLIQYWEKVWRKWCMNCYKKRPLGTCMGCLVPDKVRPHDRGNNWHSDCIPCHGCGKAIPGKKVNGWEFHPKCQPCLICKEPARGENFTHDECHIRCKPCELCGKAREGQTALVKGRYHADCGEKRKDVEKLKPCRGCERLILGSGDGQGYHYGCWYNCGTIEYYQRFEKKWSMNRQYGKVFYFGFKVLPMTQTGLCRVNMTK